MQSIMQPVVCFEKFWKKWPLNKHRWRHLLTPLSAKQIMKYMYWKKKLPLRDLGVKLFKLFMTYLYWSQFSLGRCDLHSQWTGACLSSQSVVGQSLQPPSRDTYFCLVNLQKNVIFFIYSISVFLEISFKNRICVLQTWHGHITVV